jgi:hypothetical protein
MAEVLPMPDERRRRLKELEAVISAGWERVVEVGRALLEIQDKELYKELGEGLTFKDYMRSRWSLPKQTAYQYIDAAKVESAIADSDVRILNEATARELAPLLRSHGVDTVAEAWSKVSDRYRGQRPPTAREVHLVLVEEGYRDKAFGVSTSPANRRVRLGQYGDKLIAAEKRLDWFIAKELGDKPLAERDKRLAIDYAEKCERMARLLREIA